MKICRALAKFPAGETGTVIRDAAGLNGTRFRQALAALIQDGDVVSCQVMKPNRSTPYEGYTLSTQ